MSLLFTTEALMTQIKEVTGTAFVGS